MAFDPMGGGQLYQDVIGHVDTWIPKKAYRHERKFQSDLTEYLDDRLNTDGGAGMFGGDPFGGQGEIPVSTERGKSRADIVVDDIVGIELKRDLSNSQTKKLDGQIRSYRKEYNFVIVCACGIKDMDGWRRLKNEYENDQGIGLEQKPPVTFIHKQKKHFGKDPRDVGGGGGLFGGGLW